MGKSSLATVLLEAICNGLRAACATDCVLNTPYSVLVPELVSKKKRT